MGGRDGHVLLGLVFLFVGLWHLYNQIKLHVTTRNFRSLTWFPTTFSRYVELYLILLGCSVFTFIELRLAPFDHDGTFKANHLHHIEHACIAIAFSVPSLFAILLDKFRPNNPKSILDIGHFLVAMAFAQEFLLFHFHTTDHVGLEGHYHVLQQAVVSVCLTATLLGIWLPKSFMVCYIRSLGVIFQGIWLIVMGYMLWTPELAPKGCSIHKDRYGRDVIKCDGLESLNRAKALVNILFSWFLIGMMGLGVGFYWSVSKVYYGTNEIMEVDFELEERDCHIEDLQGFLHKKGIVPIDLEE